VKKIRKPQVSGGDFFDLHCTLDRVLFAS